MIDKAVNLFINELQNLGLTYNQNIFSENLPSSQIDNSFDVIVTGGIADRKNAADFTIRSDFQVNLYVVNYAEDVSRMNEAIVMMEKIIEALTELNKTDNVVKNISFRNFSLSFLDGSERIYRVEMQFEVWTKMQTA